MKKFVKNPKKKKKIHFIPEYLVTNVCLTKPRCGLQYLNNINIFCFTCLDNRFLQIFNRKYLINISRLLIDEQMEKKNSKIKRLVNKYFNNKSIIRIMQMD